MHKAWRDVKEAPYNFSRSFIKFQGHTGWKIDNLNPIWVSYKAGRSYQIHQICLVYNNCYEVNCLQLIVLCVIYMFVTNQYVNTRVLHEY